MYIVDSPQMSILVRVSTGIKTAMFDISGTKNDRETYILAF